MKNTQNSHIKPHLPHEGALLGSTDVRAIGNELRLVSSHCQHCDARIFPSNTTCPFCLSEEMETVPLSKTGSLYSFTIIHIAPATWEVPYGIAYVDLPEGIRVFGKLAHGDSTRWELDQQVRIEVACIPGADDQAAQYQYFFDAV